MKAVVLENKGVITYDDVPTPTPQPGHVLLQVQAVSICGSDIMRFTKGHRTYPMILGHECAGIIAQVGDGVDTNLVGKHAAVIPLVPCFECEQCKLGRYSACHRYSFIGSRQPGGYAEYVELPERNAFILPAALKLEEAALLEPSTVARHIIDLGKFVAGQTAMVLGAGSVGLMAVQWLRILGAKQIICSDILDENLTTARALGAHVTLNPKNVDGVDEIKKLTGDGVDLALEVAGAPQTLLQTIQVTRPRGNIVCGGNQPLDQTLPLSFIEDMMRKELSINGCFMSYSAPFPGHEWSDSLTALMNGTLMAQPLISHRYPLSQAPQVFNDIAARKLAHRKIILNPESV